MIKNKNAPDVPMIDRRPRPNWKLVHVPNRVYINNPPPIEAGVCVKADPD